MDILDKIEKFGQKLRFWTKIDNFEKIEEFGQN